MPFHKKVYIHLPSGIRSYSQLLKILLNLRRQLGLLGFKVLPLSLAQLIRQPQVLRRLAVSS